MKWIKNIFAASAVAIAAVACTIESEDTFSQDPVAPVLDTHSDILITEGTKAESVTFTWTAARQVEADAYLYNLNVKNGDKEVALKEGISDNFYMVSKEDLRTFLKTNFELEQNATHELSFSVSIADNAGNVYTSPAVGVKVYFYDNAVASVANAPASTIVLDKEKPAEELELLSWTDARLVYGEDVTYKVTMTYGSNKEKVLAEGIAKAPYMITVDNLNEAAVSAGAPEGSESELTLKVYAYCESIPDGVVSNEVKVNVTTYIATFPEKMWLPGSFQNTTWDPASAPVLSVSTKQKGLYQGFVDLTTKDGADAEFKFSATPSWSETDFGFEDVTVETKGSAELSFAYAESKTVGKSNIKVPSGLYFIQLDKKFGKLVMIQVKNLEIGGSFAASDWGTFFKMTKNGSEWAADEEFEMKENDEIKIRFNSDWTYSFGGELGNVAFGGDNIKFTNPEGKYKLVFDTKTSDFVLNAMNMDMPDYLVVAGDYSGHNWGADIDMKVWLRDNVYRGYITMYSSNNGFKFVKNGSIWYGGTETSSGIYTLGNGDNLKIADGSYCWTVDMKTMTATAVKIDKAGIIGSFAAANNWGNDVLMNFDATSLTWSVEADFEAGNEFKFRFNENWDYNLGKCDDFLAHNGDNIKIDETGKYLITLDMAHGSNPTYTIVKK